MLEAWSAIITGGSLMLGGACLGIKQMLSAEDRPNYPSASPWARFIMFWLSALLIVWGINIISVGAPISGYGVMTAPFLAAHFAGRLYTHLSQKASPRTQQSIARIRRMARCAPNEGLIKARTSAALGKPIPAASAATDALVALSLEGVRVAAPNEGPEAFNGPWQ